jgi:hypothetical protein
VKRHYSGPAKALFAVVENDVLAGRGARKRRIEAHLHGVGGDGDAAGDIRLPMTQLGRAGERRGRRVAANPVRCNGHEADAVQRRVICALYDHERVAREVLRRNEPGRIAAAGETAYTEAAPLAERVALEATVPADHCPVLVLDRPGAARQPAPDEVAERALADKTDAGRVRLVGHGDAALARERTHFGLAHAADGELAKRELNGIHCMQEVALVLVAVGGSQQASAVADARVMSGREALRAEAPRVVEADAELDLAVTENVGIRRTPGPELGQEACEYALAVLRSEARLVQRDAELLADAASVLEIGGRGAITVVVLAPVGHEKGLDPESRVDEQCSRDGGIHTARHRDDDPRHGPQPVARLGRRPANGTWFSNSSG